MAFQTPNGSVSLVAMNRGDDALGPFDLYDEQLGAGVTGISLPPHSIQSYVLPAANVRDAGGPPGKQQRQQSSGNTAAASASAAATAATVTLLTTDASPSTKRDGASSSSSSPPPALGASAALAVAAALVAAAALGRRAIRQHGAHSLLRGEEEADAWEAAVTAVEPVDAIGGEQPYALMHDGDEGRD